MTRITTVYGATGSGKSHLVKGALARARRIIVFDPQHEYGSVCGGEIVSNAGEMIEAMAGDMRGFKVAYQPKGEADMVEQLHTVACALWDWQDVVPGTATLVIEEANRGYPNEKVPAKLRGMQKLVLQGRHRNIQLVGISQRPALVNPDLRTNAGRVVLFRLADYSDRQTVGRMFGPNYISNVSVLQDRESISFINGVPAPANDNFSI